MPVCADVPEVQFFSVTSHGSKAQGSHAAGSSRSTTSRLAQTGAPAGSYGSIFWQGGGSGGASSRAVGSSGRVAAGGKLPVVSSQALAMATVNRQLMVSAAPDPGAASPSSLCWHVPMHSLAGRYLLAVATFDSFAVGRHSGTPPPVATQRRTPVCVCGAQAHHRELATHAATVLFLSRVQP